ncbi:MAG: TonB-dependent receptor [Vicinamibacteria bacterium]|nr:TonB-dependent receptor [Vicinamibacteria bacterium]
MPDESVKERTIDSNVTLLLAAAVAVLTAGLVTMSPPTSAAAPIADETTTTPEPAEQLESENGESTSISPALHSPEPPRRSVSEQGRRGDRGQRRDTAITGSQLVELGFFQDFEEISLDSLLNPDVLETTTSLGMLGEQSLDVAPGAISVLTSADIANLGCRSLEQLLDLLPGFDLLSDSLGRARLIARGMPTGGMGGVSENIVVMINGHRLNEAISGGATSLNFGIPVNHIKKLEVLRGPATLLYGGGALAAVVNVVTEDPGEYTGIKIGSGLGSYWTNQQSLKLGNSLREIDVWASFALGSSSGSQVIIPADAQSLADRRGIALGQAAISHAPFPVNDDYSTLDALYRIAYRGIKIDWRAHQQRTGGYVGYANSFGRDDSLFSKQMSFDTTYSREIASLGSLRSRLSLTLNDRRELFEVIPPGFEGVRDDGLPFRIDSAIYLQTNLQSRRYAAETLLVRDVSGHRLVTGLTLEREATHDLEAQSNLSFADVEPLAGLEPIPGAVFEASRNSLGAFIQDAWSPKLGFELTGGVRVDVLNDAGAFMSPRLGAVLALPRDLTFKLLYARAFRPPTFTELYFSLPGFTANPDLRAVTAQSVEGILLLRRHNLRASATAFAHLVRDAIPSERPSSPFATTALRNVPGYDIHGLELEGRLSSGLNTFFASYTLQRPHDAETGLRIGDLPTHLGTLGAILAFGGRYTVSPIWKLRSQRPRAPDDSRRRVPGFGWIDVAFRATDIYDTLELSATIHNLFDQPIFDPAPLDTVHDDYPRPGRRFYIQATYEFQ